MQKENDILIKSLKFINQGIIDENIILNSSEFLNIHNRNIAMLKKSLEINNSNMISEEINKYPKIDESEIRIYFDKKKKEISMLRVVGGIILDSFFSLLKNRGQTYDDIKNKMSIIVTINEKLIELIENPYLERFVS